MKTITNIKRRVKNSIKHRAQRKYKTHKNKHAKTQLKQYKTHRGGSASVPQSEFDIRSIDITSHNINDFINAYTNSNASPNNFCKRIQFNDINDNTLINNAINIITTQFTQLYTLVIVNCNITVLPESIGNLTQLTTLGVLSCYALTKLPDSIGNLTALTTLELRGCIALETLPDSIEKLTKLTTLTISICEALKTLPDSIGNLTVLETLGLFACAALTHLPKSFWLLLNLRTITYTYNDTIKNPEILYLMPQITLSKDDNTKYLNKIKADSDDNLMYNIKISDLNSFLITQLKAYELNIDKSIVEQIEIFTNLRNSSNA